MRITLSLALVAIFAAVVANAGTLNKREQMLKDILAEIEGLKGNEKRSKSEGISTGISTGNSTSAGTSAGTSASNNPIVRDGPPPPGPKGPPPANDKRGDTINMLRELLEAEKRGVDGSLPDCSRDQMDDCHESTGCSKPGPGSSPPTDECKAKMKACTEAAGCQRPPKGSKGPKGPKGGEEKRDQADRLDRLLRILLEK